ncbi:20844_t:CDS:1, partial [Entrophospora sp. SA101]
INSPIIDNSFSNNSNTSPMTSLVNLKPKLTNSLNLETTLVKSGILVSLLLSLLLKIVGGNNVR